MNYYILFENHTQGMALHQRLDEAGLENRICPTPRCGGLKISCGMSLLIREPWIERVKAFLNDKREAYKDIAAFEGTLNAGRDRYC